MDNQRRSFANSLSKQIGVKTMLAFSMMITTILITLVSNLSFTTATDLEAQTIQSGEPGNWTKYSGNPVMTPSQEWESTFIWHANVMKDGFTYKMWYTANDPSHIGYATSVDGILWNKHAENPILAPGSVGEWDEIFVGEPYVIKEDNQYKMWFFGRNADGFMQIGYATSTDGISWIKYAGNPVFMVGDAGSWEELEVGLPCIIHQGGTYKMWYTGQDRSGNYAIGYATSPDGINWTRYGSNPIFTPTIGTWDEDGVYGSEVLFDGTTYRMWYSTPIEWEIGYATSQNGIDWTKSSNSPILGAGSLGEWDEDGVVFPSVLLDGGRYKMWYTSHAVGYALAPEIIGPPSRVYLPFITSSLFMVNPGN